MDYLQLLAKKLIEDFGYRDVTDLKTLQRTAQKVYLTRGNSEIVIDGPSIRYLNSGIGIIHCPLDDMNLIGLLSYSLLPDHIMDQLPARNNIGQFLEELTRHPETEAERIFTDKAVNVLYRYKVFRQLSDKSDNTRQNRQKYIAD